MTIGKFSIFAGLLFAFIAINILLLGNITREVGAMICFILTGIAGIGFIGYGLAIKDDY